MKDVIFFIGVCFFGAALDYRYLVLAILGNIAMIVIKLSGVIK